MNLAATQRALQRALLHPEAPHLSDPEAPGLSGPEAPDGEQSIVTEILAAPPISPRQRLRIYTDAYALRLIEALRANFPKLYLVLGDDDFATLGREFARAQPSNTASIRWFGRHLPEYLTRTAPFADQPILAELARFEWLLSEAFDAADADAVNRAQLQALDPARWEHLTLSFHPSVRRVELRWNTVAVWQAASAQSIDAQGADARDINAQGVDAQGAAAPAIPDPQRIDPATWVLWRREFQNHFRSLDAKEALALDFAITGRSFADLCLQLAGVMPEDEVPLHAATLLASWVETGMITALS